MRPSHSNARKRIAVLLLVGLCFLPTSDAQSSFCGDLLTRLGNRVKRAFGILPDGVSIVRVQANSTDHAIWAAYLRNGAENLAVEIFDRNGNRIALVGPVTSGRADLVTGKDAGDAFARAMDAAHSRGTDTGGWTIRMVHNHPGGFPHSLGDHRAAMTYKHQIELMGYHDSTFRMDVMYGPFDVASTSFGPEISLKNQSYAPSRSLQSPDAVAALENLRASFNRKTEQFLSQVEKKFGIHPIQQPLSPELQSRIDSFKKDRRGFMIFYGANDTRLEKAKVHFVDRSLKLKANLIAPAFDQAVFSDLEDLDRVGRELRVYLSPSENHSIADVIEAVLDLRAVLDRFGFRPRLTVQFSGMSGTREIILPFEFSVDGIRYVSEGTRLILEKMNTQP